MSARSNLRRIYGMPFALAILSGIGLISALLADGIWDVLSWIALSANVAVIAWHVVPARSIMSCRPLGRESHL